MAYVAPTIGDLKARFPEFATLQDAQLTAVLEEAIVDVGPSWVEKDRAPAQLYLAAHLLASQGAADGGLSAVAGPIKRDKVGDVETEFAGAVASLAGYGEYGATAYGRRFADLMRRNFPAVAVV